MDCPARRTGRVTCLIGPDGAGKTTTIASILGLVPAWAGAITLDGTDLARLPTHERSRRGIGVVPQGRRIFPNALGDRKPPHRCQQSSRWLARQPSYRACPRDVPCARTECVSVWAAASPVGSSRCWPWGARSWPSRDCSYSTSPRWVLSPRMVECDRQALAGLATGHDHASGRAERSLPSLTLSDDPTSWNQAAWRNTASPPTYAHRRGVQEITSEGETRGQRSEVRGQRSEVRGRGQRSEVRGQRSETRIASS